MSTTHSFARRSAMSAAVACFCLIAPAAARAQGEAHDMSELETMPKFSSAGAAARLIQKSYPDALKRAGVNGTVQLAFVVSAQGKVEPGTVEVIAASAPALGEAAKQIADKIEFTPGMIKGEAVRARVLLPLIYKAN
jgi:TonB family protein